MDDHTLEALGWPRIRELLVGFCTTDCGRELALALLPSSEQATVATALARLTAVIELPEEPPLAEVSDTRPLLAVLRVQGVLSGPELLKVLRTCRGLRRCSEFLRRHRAVLAAIDDLVRAMPSLIDLETTLSNALDDNGDVLDSASTELATIRSSLRRKRANLVKELERIVSEHPDWFSGGVALRGERLVLPLRHEHRARVRGVVHGSSGTGQTLYVEPLTLVNDGNEFQELKDAEDEEVARILRGLSRSVAAEADRLTTALAAVAELDLLVAKRRFAVRFDCRRPEIAADGSIEIVDGRHPLLEHKGVAVVPLCFRFPDDASVVLISGPNAGGKTVVLKTLGLFSLMLGSGMYLPARTGTKLPVFGAVFADIGDEQSLDTGLSSFTAHIGRLKEILKRAESSSLVLIDEIGASTAPEEGAALASAVLEVLRDRGVRSVVTTHFGALKVSVQDQPGMVNAAMEWGTTRRQDGKQSYGPTYRLRMGFPGESSAFEIAAAAGMPDTVLERARQRIGHEWFDLAAKLRALDEELTRAQAARRLAEQELASARQSRHELEEKVASAKRALAAEHERMRSEQEHFLLAKRREIENLVRQIKEQQADRDSVVAAKRAVEDGLRAIASAGEPANTESGENDKIAVGDSVWSRMLQRQGVVVELDSETADVVFGQIRMQLRRTDLTPVPKSSTVSLEPAAGDDSYSFDPHLKIIGMTRDDAEIAVRRFLDDAAVCGARELWVLHGKGAGVLRRMVWQLCRADGRVEEVRLAEPAQGGRGVSVIRLRA